MFYYYGKDMRKVCNSGVSALDTQHAVGGNAWNSDTSREDTEQKSDLYQNPKKIKS